MLHKKTLVGLDVQEIKKQWKKVIEPACQQLDSPQNISLFLFNSRVELVIYWIIDNMRDEILKNEKVFSLLKSVLIHLHQNILSFIHMMAQKLNEQKSQELVNTIQQNNATCISSLRQLCQVMENKDYSQLEKLLRKIEISNSVRVAAVISFDQELKMIGIDKIVNLMTPEQGVRKGTPKKMPTNNEAQLDRKMETDLSDIELYLPKKKDDGRDYTLVLDLDETLIHFDPQTRQFRSRPFCLGFLRNLSAYYEIVVFTAATKNYADQIIDALDPEKTLIDFRLYRQHTKPQDGVYYKDLKPLGRDLRKTIIVDNIADNFAKQKENGIEIKGWYFEKEDTELRKLQQFFL